LTITEYLEKQRTSVLLVVGAVLFVMVAIGDYLTHTNFVVEFAPFYLVPVTFFSWFMGKRAGVAVVLTSIAISFFIRLRLVPAAIAYWDVLVLFALYMSATLLMAHLKRLYERERQLSRIDPLTMVENRRAFLESAARARNFSDRRRALLSIAYIDLDDFKHWNDHLGHSTGDEILAAAAAAIRNALRPTDVVARIGGDEFAMLLPETDKETASRALDRVRLELERTMRERRWSVTFSIGLVSFSPPLGSVLEMIKAADQTMYAAKSLGKNRVEQRDVAV